MALAVFLGSLACPAVWASGFWLGEGEVASRISRRFRGRGTFEERSPFFLPE